MTGDAPYFFVDCLNSILSMRKNANATRICKLIPGLAPSWSS